MFAVCRNAARTDRCTLQPTGLGILLPLALVVVVSPALAAEKGCPLDGGAFVVLRAEQTPAPFAAEVRAHLGSALASRGIGLCESDDKSAAAVLEFDTAGDGVTIVVSVRDAITDKRVARDLDMRALPLDARPLAVAQSADELLRASWAELVLEGGARSVDRAPEVIRQAVQPRAPEPRIALEGAFAFEGFTSGHLQLGPDARLSLAPWPSFVISARGGLRTAASVDSRYGSVVASGTSASIGVGGRHRWGRRWTFEAGPVVSWTHLRLRGRPRVGVEAQDASLSLIHVSAEGRASVLVTEPLTISAALSLGAAARSGRVLAGAELIHEVAGAAIGSQIALGLRW